MISKWHWFEKQSSERVQTLPGRIKEKNEGWLKACLQGCILTPAPIRPAPRRGEVEASSGTLVSMATAHSLLMQVHLILSGCSSIWHLTYFIEWGRGSWP